MTDKDRIPTTLRLVLVLEALSKSRRAMSPSEIGRELGLAKQTIHRLCRTLLDEGFVTQDHNGRFLRASRRTREMAAGLLHGPIVHTLRHQVLIDLADKVRETVNFVVPEDRGMVYVDRVETQWAFRVQLPVGTHVPFHCTASGKTYLASLPRAGREVFVRSLKLEPHTARTLRQPEDLLAELDRVSQNGYAIDDQEFIDAMTAIAVPVTAPDGTYVASLAFHGPTQRLSVAQAVSQRELLFNAAEELQKALFDFH